MKHQFSIIQYPPHERPSRSFMGGAALVALFVLLLPLPVEAARLFSSGCELQGETPGTATDLLEWDTNFDVASNLQISTTIKRSGLSSCQVNTDETHYGTFDQLFDGAGTVNDMYFRFYFYIATGVSNASDIMTVLEASTDEGGGLVLNTNRTFSWADDSGVMVGTSPFVLSLGKWYRIEVNFDAGNDTTVRIDGTEVLAIPTNDAEDGATLELGICGGDFVCTDESGDLYFDDVAINDTSGTAQTSWPGPGAIVHLQPDSAGDTDNATSTPTSWQNVDEITPDEATTVAWMDADTDILDVNMESSLSAGISPLSVITLVQGGIREQVDGAASATWQLGVKSQSGGTVQSGTATTHNDRTFKTNGDNSPRNYTLTSYTNPQAGNPWTPLLLDSMQIRASSTEATPDIGITTLWALVEYVVPQARLGLKNARIKFSGGRIKLRSTNQ